MKKRQSRFKETTSKTLEQLETIEKRKRRQLRFGAVAPSNASSQGKAAAPSVDLTVLKKRSEKFNIVTATTLLAAEEEAKLEARKNRFSTK